MWLPTKSFLFNFIPVESFNFYSKINKNSQFFVVSLYIYIGVRKSIILKMSVVYCKVRGFLKEKYNNLPLLIPGRDIYSEEEKNKLINKKKINNDLNRIKSCLVN